MDPKVLINQCRSGDLSSFEDLYKLYRQKALGTAYLIAGRRSIAEDIVQEAFIICYSQIRNLKNPDVFHIWFYRILVRVGWRMTARLKNTTSYEDNDASRNEFSSGYVPVVPFSDIYNDRLLVREAVKKLSPPLKSVVILYYFNELTIREISRVLDCFQGTVKSRLYKARKLLEKELENSFEKEPGPKLGKKELTVNEESY